MNDDPAKKAWQASVEIAGVPPLEEVRKGANKFYRFVKWRNRVEYIACVVVVVVFSSYALTLPHPLQKVGSVLIVLATFYVAWQLHRRASAVPPEAAGAMPLLLFARVQMVRQRDALRSLFWWYLLPFIPGMLLIVAGSIRQRAVDGRSEPLLDLIGGSTIALVFVLIWWLNQRAASKLQRHIDEVDALIGGNA